MKKLVAIAAISAVGSLLAVESANIVGYQNKEITKNLSSQMPSFAPVSAETLDIQDLIPVVTESGKSMASGDYVIQIYGETGIRTEAYYYYLAEDTEDEVADGWYDKDGVNLAERTFTRGEGFMMYSKKVGGVVFSGEVDGEQLELTVGKNLSHQGNPRPTSVDVQDLVPVVTESGKSMASGDYVIQIYGETGIRTEAYYFYLAEDTEDEVADGWYDKDGVNLAERTFTPGEGFMMSAKKAGKLVFPALGL